MNLSRNELATLIEELAPLLVPSRVQRIYQAAPHRLIFQLRAPGHTFHLLTATAPDDTRLHLVHDKPRQAAQPTPFAMQLRKWLQGAWIDAITLHPQDRIIDLRLQAIDPEWEPKDEDDRPPRLPLTLIVEAVPVHPNIFLIGADQTIIGTAHRQALEGRETKPGTPYKRPHPPAFDHDQPALTIDLPSLPPDGSRSAALEEHLGTVLEQHQDKELRQELTRALRTQRRRLKRRITHIEADLTKIDDAQRFKKWGQLLQSAYGKVKPGAKSVAVPDFYQEGMPLLEIPLDPAKNLQQNIDRYFHQYRRFSQAKDQVEDRLLESMDLLEQIKAAQQKLPQLDTGQALRDFQVQLQAQRLLPRRPPQRAHRKDAPPLPPYREFRARSGATILVGRGARHNDRLTTSIARGRDIWLHARDWAGAHVVLRTERGQDPASEDLIDAALLAAHFSRGREDTIVDVTYAQAKHVRKPPGSPPGRVTIAGGSTIAIREDKARLKRLLESEIFPDETR